ncbi:MAG TPA: uroporphyrinogen decarboxylase family protein, partial [Negativicutes bacterium]
MKHRQRIEAAIRHLPLDRLPCAEFIITDSVVEKWSNNPSINFEDRWAFNSMMGLDAICLHPSFRLQLGQIPFAEDAVFNDLVKWVKMDYFVFAVLPGPVSWGEKLLGFNQFMSKLARCHPDILYVMNAIEILNKNLMERLVYKGINGVIIADDIAFNERVIVHPEILRQTLFPALTRQVGYAKKLNLPVFFHSYGNLMPVLGDVVEAGFEGLHCIDPLAEMDLGQIKRQHGDKLCLWGNMELDDLCGPICQEKLQQKVNGIISVASDASGGGGFIFGTSSGLFEGISLESLRYAYQIAQTRIL